MKPSAKTRPTARKSAPGYQPKNRIAEIERRLDYFTRRTRNELKELRQRVDEMSSALAGSDVELSPSGLRALNQKQAREGIARLKASLDAMKAMKIIDERGKSISDRKIPVEALADHNDV